MSPTGRGLLECPTYQPVTLRSPCSLQTIPILNSPYDEPARHYATDAQGNLNYRDIRRGPPYLHAGRAAGAHRPAEPGQHVRPERLPGGVRRTPDQPAPRRAARLACNPAIGVSVVASLAICSPIGSPTQSGPRTRSCFSPAGGRRGGDLAQRSGGKIEHRHPYPEPVAAAPGDGKRRPRQPPAADCLQDGHRQRQDRGHGCLIAYHYLNRREYRNDTRYVDYFLVPAPGITIRNRLNVLLPDQQSDTPFAAGDYYQQRYLVPPAYQHALGELGHRLIITNYHEFLPRILGGNKRTPSTASSATTAERWKAERTKARSCVAFSVASKEGAGYW
jgi:type III restriction enzyme